MPLSWPDFAEGCHQLVKSVPFESDDWLWIEKSKRPYQAFLALRNQIRYYPGSSEMCICEYHIVYNTMFHAPTLYCSGLGIDGEIVDMLKIIPFHQSQIPLAVVSTEEHPILGDVQFYVHPCQIDDMVQQLSKASVVGQDPMIYMQSWLSIMAPLMQLPNL